jgi:hypothetical protein
MCDLLAQQLVFDADGGHHRLQAPLLLIIDLRLAALQTDLAAGQETIALPGQRSRGDAIFPGTAFQVGAAQ